MTWLPKLNRLLTMQLVQELMRIVSQRREQAKWVYNGCRL